MGVRPKSFLEDVEFTHHGFRAYDVKTIFEMLSIIGFKAIKFSEFADKEMGLILISANK